MGCWGSDAGDGQTGSKRHPTEMVTAGVGVGVGVFTATLHRLGL